MYETWKPVVAVATAGMGSPLAAAMIVGAASGFTSVALGTALNGGNVGQVLGSGFLNAGTGAVGGLAGGDAAGLASRYVGSVAINSLNVAGRSAIGGFLSGTIGGVAGGFVGGYVVGYLMTGDAGVAWDMAINGSITGGIRGGIFGGFMGFRAARALGKNPWTGIGEKSGVAAKTGVTRINSARVLLRSAEETGPFHNFPAAMDEGSFSQGTKTVTPNFFRVAKPGLSNTGIMYELPGTINGTEGLFQIGVRPSLSGNTELIMHRFFKPTF